MRPARKTSGLAALLLLAVALIFGAAQPAAADPRLQTVSPCAKVALSLNFNGVTGANCAGGKRFQSPALVTGWSFTRASPETCSWASGDLTFVTNNVPCMTDLGLGVWESRTNLLLQSGALANAAWSKDAGLTINSSTMLAPDGTASAVEVQGDGSDRSLFQAVTIGSSSTYQASIWAKKTNSADTVILAIQTAVSPSAVTTQAAFTLTTTWTRYNFSVTSGAADTSLSVRYRTWTTAAAKPMQLWGAQAELGAFPTPYIPTTSAAVTRAADVASITGLAVSGMSFPGALATRILTDHASAAVGTVEWPVQVSDGTVNNRIGVFRAASPGDVGFRYVVGGVASNPGNAATVWASPGVHGASMRWSATGVTGVADALAVTPGAAPSGLPVLTTVNVGTDQAGANQLNGYLQQVTISR